jgi:hypothetical protein
MDDKKTIDANTNTNPNNNISIINAGKLKKKPHNITIKNFNPNEPKTRQSQILYSDKQNYRRYKTKTEPKLYSKIMIDEEDDLVAKIRKEFGITADNKKTNYSDANTSGANYVKDPEPVAGKQTQPPKYNYEISDISRDENEDIRGELIGLLISKLDLGEPIDLDIDYKAVLESADDEEEPAALTREDSTTSTILTTADITEMALKFGSTPEKLTELSTQMNDLEKEYKKRGLPLFRGTKPTQPAALEARIRKLEEKIAEDNIKRASAGGKASKKK